MGKLKIVSHSQTPFKNRQEAGMLLGGYLKEYGLRNAVVLGIPKGGVAVARSIAEVIGAEVDIVISSKIGAPGNPELAIGAVSENGDVFIDARLMAEVEAGGKYIEEEKARLLVQMKQRLSSYRTLKPKVPLRGRQVIITDDGMATGSTMQAAVWALKEEKPERIIAAVPVAPVDALVSLAKEVDETICLQSPELFYAVGEFYRDFTQVSDSEVAQLLEG